jgi:hypothetical protein
MTKKIVIVVVLVLLTFVGCKKYLASLSDEKYLLPEEKDNKIGYITSDNSILDVEKSSLAIADGNYVAEVTYATKSSPIENMVTQVVVNDGYVVEIKWVNGAWLSANYFHPSKINTETGECEIHNIEDAYNSKVKILNLAFANPKSY